MRWTTRWSSTAPCPFTTGSAEHEHPETKGRENGLENFFLMVGLDAKARREARNARPKMTAAHVVPAPGDAASQEPVSGEAGTS